MPVAIIINPIAGGARRGVARARVELATAITTAHGESVEVSVTERAGHARELAAAAARQGRRLVIAWGGDGTINEVGGALAFTGIPLGIVPSGSGNGLARELGVDPRPDKAIADALRAAPRSMDLGEVGGRLFVNVAGIGFDAYVASRFNNRRNRRRGLVNYAAVAARALGTYRPVTYTIATGEQRVSARAILISIANSAQFGNGARIAPGALVDDGRLDLVIVEERSRWRTLGQIPRLFNGTVEDMPGCSMQRIERVRIQCDQPMIFHVDGEPVQGGTEIAAQVHPGALQIAVR